MKKLLAIAVAFSLFGATASVGQAPPQLYQSALERCARTFDTLAASDDHWGLEPLCELKVEGAGTVEFRISRWGVAVHRNEFTVSDLMGYAALYAHEGFFLRPTSDPRTFRLGAKQTGHDAITYRHADLGGVYSYAHLVGDRAIWIRCNETLVSCMYYDDLLLATPITDRWGIQRTCSFRWSISFSAPDDDEQIAAYLATILPFVDDFRAMRKDQLVASCLRPGHRQLEK